MNCICGVSLTDEVIYCPLHEAAPELLEALKAVEWLFLNDEVIEVCPWCKRSKIFGHAKKCQRQQAIALVEGSSYDENSDYEKMKRKERESNFREFGSDDLDDLNEWQLLDDV